MKTSNILNVRSNAVYDHENIVRYEYHTHRPTPYESTTVNNNDEIHIPILQQDIYTLSCESYLFVECQLVGENGQRNEKISSISNGIAFLLTKYATSYAEQKLNVLKMWISQL